jgi:hypothetical protein
MQERRRKALGFPGARAGTRAATPARAGSSGTRVCPHGSDMLDVPAWRLGRRNARPRPRGRADLRRAGGKSRSRRATPRRGRRAMTSSSRRPRAPGERASGMRDARITRSVTGKDFVAAKSRAPRPRPRTSARATARVPYGKTQRSPPWETASRKGPASRRRARCEARARLGSRATAGGEARRARARTMVALSKRFRSTCA